MVGCDRVANTYAYHSAPDGDDHELYRVIRLLERGRIHYRLDRYRDDSIMVTVTLVGERIEIDVFEDRHIEYSRLRGNDDIEDDFSLLEALLRSDGNEQRSSCSRAR